MAQLFRGAALACLLCVPAPAHAFDVLGFSPGVWPRTDAELGVTEYVIEDFEDASLTPGLTVSLSGASTNNFAAAPTLPGQPFDPVTQDPNAQAAFVSGIWDGTRVLLNRHPASPLPAAYEDLNFGNLTFAFDAGASSVGFSLQGVDLTTPILVNGVQIAVVSDYLPPDTTGRNGYLRIDGNGEAIYSVTLVRGATATLADGFVVDHLAFRPLSIVRFDWKARVESTNVTGTPPLDVSTGDAVSGFFDYDTSTAGTLSTTLDYLGAIVRAEAQVGTDTVVAGAGRRTIGHSSTPDSLYYIAASTGGVNDGALNGTPAETRVAATFLDTSGTATTDTSMPLRAPRLGIFDAASTVNIGVTTASGSIEIEAVVLAAQSQPFVDSDRDRDAISNSAELQLGLNPDNAGDATLDLDGDTFSNLREVRAGADPANAASVPGPGYLRLAVNNTNVDYGDPFIPIDIDRFGGDAGQVSVQLRTSDLSALAGVHYQSTNETVTWQDGELGSRRVLVPVIPVTVIDVIRTLRLDLVNPTGGAEIAVAEALAQTFSNTYDAQGLPFAGFLDTQRFQGRINESAGALEALVNRRGSSSGRVTVDYVLAASVPALNDNRTLGQVVGSLVWDDGDASSKVVTVPIHDDLVAEPEADFSLTLVNPTGNAYTGINGSTFTLDDEDVFWRQSDSVGFGSRGVRVIEGEGTVRFSLHRTGPTSDQPLSVTVALAAQPIIPQLAPVATPGLDFDASVFPRIVQWGANDTAVKEFAVPIVDNTGAEPIELFTTFLTTGQSGPATNRRFFSVALIFDGIDDLNLALDTDLDGVPDIGDLDIDNDDIIDPLDAFPLDETESSNLDGDPLGDNIDADLDGDGIGNNIETALGLDPSTSGDGGIDPDADGFSTAREVASGSDPTSGASAPGPGFIELATLNMVAAEDARGAIIDVHRVRGDSGPLSVRLTTVNGDALAGVDYTTVNQVLNWADGDISARTVTIPLFDRSGVNGNRSFEVRLTAEGATSPDRLLTSATPVLVLDDDFAAQGATFGGVLSVTSAGVRVRESKDAVTINVERHGSTTGTATVQYVTLPDRATPGLDFMPRAGTLTWFDGDVEPKAIVVPIVDDLDIEGMEAFSVLLLNPSSHVTIEADETYVQIVDDELVRAADVVTPVSIEPYFRETAGAVTIPLRRIGDGTGGVVVDITYTDIEAEQNVDYLPPSDFVVWQSGETGTRDIAFTLLDDADFEDFEGFEIRLESVSPGVLLDDPVISVFIADPEDIDLVSDADADGAVDFADLDDDNDGILDFEDPFPVDADSDGDGQSDTVDVDDDNDGMSDVVEAAFPFLNRLDAADAALDFDGDGISNLRETRAGYRPDNAASIPDAGYVSLTNGFFQWEETDGAVPVEVRRLRGDVGEIAVNIQTVFVSSVEGIDYLPVDETLTWADGDSTPRVVNIVLPQTAERRGGIFGVRLSPVADARILVDELRVLVLESDLEYSGTDFGGEIRVASDALRVPESAGLAVVHIERRGSAQGIVTVDYQVVPASGIPATAGSDFVSTSGTLVWLDGDRAPKQVAIPIIDDSAIEATESIELRLSNAPDNVSLTPFGTSIQIVDDEIVQNPNSVGAVTFLSYLAETEPIARVRFLRMGSGVGAASVAVGFAATPERAATAGVDFDATPQTIVWADGETGLRTLEIPMLDDATLETPVAFEVIPLSLSPVTGAIQTEWFWPTPVVFDIEDIDFTTDTDADGSANIWDVDDDNDLILDFNDPTPLDADTDGDGQSNAVDLDDDNDDIQDTVEAAYPFLNPLNAADAELDFDGDGISNVRETQSGSLPNDPTSLPDAGYLSFTVGYVQWEETDGSVNVEVRRLRGNVGEVSVVMETFDGSAVADRDYGPATIVHTWPDGDSTPREIKIPILQTPERRDGVFGVRLTPVGNERILVDEMRVLIRESDLDFTGTNFGGYIDPAFNELRIPESAGSATIYVDRLGSTQGVATVDYELIPYEFGPATPGVDYPLISGTLTWADGDRAPQPIILQVIDDVLIETTETLQLRLSNATGNVVLSPYSPFVHIVDDEIARAPNAVGPVTFISFLEEPEPAARVRFVRSGDGTGEVTVSVGFDGTPSLAATAGTDFDGTPQTLVWADGETGFRDLLIPQFDDAALDNAFVFEQIGVSITSVTGANLSDVLWPNPVVFDLEDLDVTTDSDTDGAPNAYDLDDDNDLILDFNDPFPLDPTNTPPDVIPVAVDDAAGSVPVGGTLGAINVLANDSNLQNPPLLVTITIAANGGVATVNADNTVAYTANTGFIGADSFEYTVTDADGDADSALVTLIVDDAPVAIQDSIEALINTSAIVNVLANDTGLANAPVTVSIHTQPVNGTLTANADNTVTYVPNIGFAGADAGLYAVRDADGDVGIGDLILFADDAPVAIGDDAGTTPAGTPLVGVPVLQNDSGLGNGPITITVVGTPANALVRVNADNTLSYVPNPGFSGTDSIVYRITDADGDVSIATISFVVSSASGIPGPNVNVVGLTPEDPRYVPDSGFRQQNEPQCAFQSDNLMRIFCVYNDYRSIELTGDSWIGASMSRDGGSNWFSRLTPHFNRYPTYTAPTAPSGQSGLGLGFAADPVIASVPGGMVVGFIASNRDAKGPGGLYMQRWFEQNSELGFAWQPEVAPIQVEAGAVGKFVDKDHMIVTLDDSAATGDTVAITATLENGTSTTREWPQGDVTFLYTVFNGSDGEIVDFEDFDLGPLAGQHGWTVEGDGAHFSIDTSPFGDRAIRIDTAGLLDATTARVPNVLPLGATRGTQIRIDLTLHTLATEPNGQFVIETPFATLTIGNGELGVLGGAETRAIPVGEQASIVLFADPVSGRFNLAIGEGAPLFDQPIVASGTTDIAIRALGAADDELFVEALAVQVATDSDIFIRQSSDYGASWREPVRISRRGTFGAALQGGYLASRGNTMLAVWRRIDDPLNTDPAQNNAIVYALSTDRGRNWSPEAVLSEICPFDQVADDDRFRSRTFPAAVATSAGFAAVWSDRGYAPGTSGNIECDTGPARIVMSQLGANGQWTAPVPVDPIPPGGQQFAHQFMPGAAVAQDQVQLAWYDTRFDASGSFTPQIDDEAETGESGPLLLRHTLDVRSVRVIDGEPASGSIQLTQFKQGVTPDDPSRLVQLERFYANGRMFQQGNTPFLGDYMAVASRAHRPTPTGGWISNQFRDVASPSQRDPVFWVSWADNRDVKGDVWRDLIEPSLYTPASVLPAVDVAKAASPAKANANDVAKGNSDASTQTAVAANAAATSVAATTAPAEPGAKAPADGVPDQPRDDGMCEVGSPSQENLSLTRNQNVYGALIRPGLQLSVPTPGKPISDIQRGFVLYLQNFTSEQRRYALAILNQPPAGRASFLQLPLPPTTVPPLTRIDAVLPPRSSIAQTVFVVAANGDESEANRVEIEVTEQDCTECESDRVVLNGGPLTDQFANPGLPFEALTAEVRAPVVGSPTATVTTPGLQFPGLQFPGLQFPGLQFPGLQFPRLQFPGLQFPRLQFPRLQFPRLQFPRLQFPRLQFESVGDGTVQPVDFDDMVEVNAESLTDGGVHNAQLAAVVGSQQMTEVVWPVTNEGNVIGSFDLKPFVNADLSGVQSQLLVVRAYVTTTVEACETIPEIHQEVIVNIANPALSGEAADVKVFMAPGETVLVILRVFEEIVPGAPEPHPVIAIDPQDASIAVAAQACNTQQAQCDPASTNPALRPPTAIQGGHPINAQFAPLLVPGISVVQTTPRLDRRTGRLVSEITVTNNSAAPVIGQLRAVFTANKPVFDADGQTASGRPFVTLMPQNNSIFAIGARVSRVVSFANTKPAPTYSTALELKSVTPP